MKIDLKGNFQSLFSSSSQHSSLVYAKLECFVAQNCFSKPLQSRIKFTIPKISRQIRHRTKRRTMPSNTVRHRQFQAAALSISSAPSLYQHPQNQQATHIAEQSRSALSRFARATTRLSSCYPCHRATAGLNFVGSSLRSQAQPFLSTMTTCVGSKPGATGASQTRGFRPPCLRISFAALSISAWADRPFNAMR